MAPRFTIVSAPIEGRVGDSLSRGFQEALALGSRLKDNVNDTLSDEELGKKAGETLFKLAIPSGLPFILLVITIAVFTFREVLIRIETKRIMAIHCQNGERVLAPNNNHQHDD